MSDPISSEAFSAIMQARFVGLLSGVRDVAIGVSGGPDSMALLKLLSDWATEQGGPHIHALIVDHGLRPESADEACHVQASSKALRYVRLNILEWDGGSVESGVQEAARHARYALIESYCQTHHIKHLFLAHHQDDQAETFLFRLAKGSGLDGLAAMKAVQRYNGLTFLRPLLDVPKARLVATCEAHNLAYIQDPSNESEAFARVRLRKSMEVLEEEGLSAKRLSVTAMRFARAREALEIMTEKTLKEALNKKDTKQVVLNFEMLKTQPEEIVLRAVLNCSDALRPDEPYAPRMEKVEALVEDLMKSEPFRKRTLGGLVIERDDKNGTLSISLES